MHYFIFLMSMQFKISTIIVLLCITLGLQAQYSNIQEYTETFAESKIFKNAFISACAQEVESGLKILDYNADKVLIPASSLKVITTLAALDILDEAHRYTTQIAYSGTIDGGGTLNGNLYLVGSGDPTLGSNKTKGAKPYKELMKDIIQSVKTAGIECITGDIIGDESVFNSYPINPTWQWNDLGNYYAAGAWGINILDNEYKIYYGQQAKEGRIPKLINYHPKIPGLKLQSEVSTGKKGSGDNAYIFGGPYNYTKRIVGTIPPGNKQFVIKGSIPDPPLYLSYLLYNALADSGIQAENYRTIFEKEKGYRKRKVIHQIESPPLGEIIKKTNFESNNLYCEAILKTIGSSEMELGSGAAGINSIRKILRRRGVNLSGMQIEDGSGLSARNKVSTRFITDFLKSIANQISVTKATTYLPKGGYQGTVRGLFSKSRAKGNIWAKSGSMNGVQSYSGYVRSKSGKWLSFSIIVNGHSENNKKVRPYLERFMIKLYELY